MLAVGEELAEGKEEEGALEKTNESVVRSLYTALAAGDAAGVGAVVHADLEWWFHGPPSEQHMMRLLTGVTTCDTFSFGITSISGIGSRVFVEGEGPSPGVFWVHIWTVKEKRITQLREYFNTAILVTDLKPEKPTPHEIQHHPCVPLWQNQLWKSKAGRSVPGLILAL